jgi:ADP-ribosylation factor family
MGQCVSCCGKDSPTELKPKILMVSLDTADQTSVLLLLSGNRLASSLRFNGYLVQTANVAPFSIFACQLSYRFKQFTDWVLRNSADAVGIIVVIDSRDLDRSREFQDVIMPLLNFEEIAHLPVLVYANNQDSNEAMNVAKVKATYGLSVLRNRAWFVQPSSAQTGEGIREGLEWMNQHFQNHRSIKNDI